MQAFRRMWGWFLFACLAISLACVLYPIYVIWPFRHQDANQLALALIVTRYRAAVTALSALAAILATVRYWQAQRAKLWRAVSTVGALLTLILAFVARVNIYELMFHPVPHATFTAAGKVKLDPAEHVIAVKMGREARAYPIRSISYHHVVNDVVGGVPIVATY